MHVLPQLWFRNTWSWNPPAAKPEISAQGSVIVATHPQLGTYHLYAEGDVELLFCENETNVARLYGAASHGYYKDAFHEYVVNRNLSAVNPLLRGSKACVRFHAQVGAGASATLRLRLSHTENPNPFADFDQIASARKSDCDEFYCRIQTGLEHEDARLVQRQAFAGMIWNKQYYEYDVRRWLAGDSDATPPPAERESGRNDEWQHFNSGVVLSMPDKWEYPWFASWDLAFHAVTFSIDRSGVCQEPASRALACLVSPSQRAAALPMSGTLVMPIPRFMHGPAGVSSR